MAEAKQIALTGATGFVGRHVVSRLLSRGYRIHALVRDPQKLTTKDTNLKPVAGDLFDDYAMEELLHGCDAVVHLIGIIMEKPSAGQTFQRIHVEATQRLLAATKRAGITRWIQMSALGSRPAAVSIYHRTKWQAEEAVRNSGLCWTIFRPSIIHGPDGEFMRMVKNFWTKRFPPFVPYFGAGVFGKNGAGRLQPICVEDVATCFSDAVNNPLAGGETYPLGGPDVLTWPQLYTIVRNHLPSSRNKRIIAVPAWYASLIAGLPGVPFNRDQVIMSQEDSICGIEKAQEHFKIKFSSFEDTLAGYASELT